MLSAVAIYCSARNVKILECYYIRETVEKCMPGERYKMLPNLAGFRVSLQFSLTLSIHPELA